MSLFRSDIQVALHTLHVAMQESADNYEFVAGNLEDPQVVKICVSIARQRNAIAEEIVAAIRDTGELPGEPDRDKEVALEIRAWVEALFADDQTGAVIEYHRQGERDLQALLNGGSLDVLEASYQSLLGSCRASIDEALGLLSSISSARS